MKTQKIIYGEGWGWYSKLGMVSKWAEPSKKACNKTLENLGFIPYKLSKTGKPIKVLIIPETQARKLFKQCGVKI